VSIRKRNAAAHTAAIQQQANGSGADPALAGAIAAVGAPAPALAGAGGLKVTNRAKPSTVSFSKTRTTVTINDEPPASLVDAAATNTAAGSGPPAYYGGSPTGSTSPTTPTTGPSSSSPGPLCSSGGCSHPCCNGQCSCEDEDDVDDADAIKSAKYNFSR